MRVPVFLFEAQGGVFPQITNMAKKFSLAENIAKLLRANKRLERQLGMIRSLSNALREGVFIIDSAGEIIFANNYATQTLFSGRKIDNIFKIVPNLEAYVARAIKNGEYAEGEFEATYPENRILKATVVPIAGDVKDATRDTVSLVLNDVTALKYKTRERIESEKIASVLKLASGIAHEIGNPLNSINIHLQVSRRTLSKMADCGEKQKIDSSLKACSEEIVRLKNIVENFLKALRPPKPDFAETDPLSPLADTLKLLEEELKNRRVVIDIKTAAATPAILGDANLLNKLYFNIIKNSMEAMPEGGRINIEAYFDDSSVIISITDSGCGISQEQISHMFEPYYTTKPNGNGLGMMIVENIVKSHGGEIEIKSEPGKGTTVLLTFPRKDRRMRALESGGKSSA